MSEESLFVPISGFQLEAAESIPAGAPAAGAVICHPHPQYGGTMDNNVVGGIQRELENSGMATLRFNFRGVGRSGGGIVGPDGDPEDVTAMVEYFRNRDGVDADKVVVIGYSYGAMVGLAASMLDPMIPALVAVSPPVGAFQMEFISRIDHPMLVISGDRDAFCPLDKLRNLLPPDATLEIVNGADHLYHTFETQVGRLVAGYLAAKLK